MPTSRRSRRNLADDNCSSESIQLEPEDSNASESHRSSNYHDGVSNSRPALVRRHSNSRLSSFPATAGGSTQLSEDKIHQVIMKRKSQRQSIARKSAAETPVAVQSPTPYWKVAREKGKMSPPLTRSAKKKKQKVDDDVERDEGGRVLRYSPTKLDKTKLNPMFGKAGGGSLSFSPPDQELNAKREAEMRRKEEEEHARKVRKARDDGRLLIFSPTFNNPAQIPGEDRSDSSPTSDITDDKGEGGFLSPPSEGPPTPVQTPIRNGLTPAVSHDTPPEQSVPTGRRQSPNREDDHHSHISAQSTGQSSDHIASELRSLRASIDNFVRTKSPDGNKAEVMRLKYEADKKQLSEMDVENETLKKKVETLSGEKRSLSDELYAEKSASSRLETELELTKRTKDAVIETLESKTKELEAQIAQLRIEKEESLNSANQTFAASASSMHEKLAESTSKIALLESEKIALHNDLIVRTNENAKLEKILAEAEARSVELEASVAGYRRKISHHENDVIPSLQEELARSTANRQSESEELSSLREQLAQVTAKYRSAADEAVSLNERMAEITSKHNSVLSSMKEQLSKAVASHRLDMDSLARSREQLAESHQQIDDLTAKMKQLEASEQNTKSQSNLQSKKAETQVAVKNAEIEDLRYKLKEQSDRLEEMQRIINETESNGRSLEGRSSQLEAENGALQERLRQATDRLGSAEAETANIVANFKALRASHDEKLSECQSMQRHINEMEAQVRAVVQDRDDARERLKSFDMRENDLFQKLRENDRVRRALHNKVMQLSGNIRVYVRVRPALPGEDVQSKGEDSSVFKYPSIYDRSSKSSNDDLSKNVIVVTEPYKDRGGLSDRRKNHRFAFDNVFDPSCEQNHIWEATEPLVQSTIDGYNVTLFAYGQTGSGKTYTMLGEGDNAGIISKSVEKLFNAKQEIEAMSRNETKVEITVEMLEIYNEQLRDLLASGSPNGKEVEVKLNSNEVVGNVRIRTDSQTDVLHILTKAQKRRCVKATASNETSSRGHLLFTIYFDVTSEGGVSRSGKLHICDLAGSERLKKSRANTHVGSELMKETVNINKSLSVLSNVIEKLQAKDANVPFRESTLTYLLRDSLGGNSKTLAIVCCNPLTSHYHESLSSLRFAVKVNKVDLKAQSNVRI